MRTAIARAAGGNSFRPAAAIGMAIGLTGGVTLPLAIAVGACLGALTFFVMDRIWDWSRWSNNS